MRYSPEWAPDGKRIAFSDKDGKVYVVTLADRKLAEIADSRRGQIRDYAWSPKGNYLAFSMPGPNRFASVYVWSAADNQLRRITDESFNAYNPAWDPQGNYLYYLSDREFSPQISTIEFNYATNRPTYIYAMTLAQRCQTSFPAGERRGDDLQVSGRVSKTAASPLQTNLLRLQQRNQKQKLTPKPPANLVIDFDGISNRVSRVPLAADNYGNLSAKTGHLLYAVGGASYYGRQGDRTTSLRIYSLKDRKETTLVEDMRGYTLSEDGSKVLVFQGPGANLYDATPQGERSRKPVSTAGLYVDRVPAEEWNQIFNEVWRRYRDWFYVSEHARL